jgi:ribosomal protein S18 acetylase RimI-like enzyme
MDHILDNPVWNALMTGNAALAEGEGEVKVFPADVAPFVGLKAITPGNLARLYQRVAGERVAAIVAPSPIDIPPVWKVIVHVQAFQMICVNPPLASAKPTTACESILVPLGDQHIPAMLELTALTNPGPFYQRTILFGSYHGIFDGERLVAMAGFRMNPGNFIEVSAVCTRPGYSGRGYARTLIVHLAGLIWARNSTPFLHVRTNNTRAIEVYRQLGFEIRHEMSISFFKKNVLAGNALS